MDETVTINHWNALNNSKLVSPILLN
jgi:hypothetical protein